MIVILSRIIPTSCADGQTLWTHRWKPGDTDLSDSAPWTEVKCPAPVLFLQKPPDSGVRLPQLLRVSHSCHMGWRCNVVPVHCRNNGRPSKQTKPANQNYCAEWVSSWDFPGVDWKICRRAHQIGSLVSIESISSCLWKLNEEKIWNSCGYPWWSLNQEKKGGLFFVSQCLNLLDMFSSQCYSPKLWAMGQPGMNVLLGQTGF